MNHSFGPDFLMIPGPTPIPDRVRQAMARQAIDFSGDEFIEIADNLFQRLKPMFGTSTEVFLYPANGHGAWEASLVNTVQAGDTILMPETGLFSEAWRAMANSLGIHSQTIPSDWRHGIDPNALEALLRRDQNHKIEAVLIVHTDTASSICSDIKEISNAIRAARHPALLMVDTIASLCTTPFHMQDMGIDVAVSASQKALMAPPGLSMVAVNDRAMERSKNTTSPRHYWCWQERIRGEHYKRFCGTAPLQLVFALSEAIAMIEEEGLPNTIKRHQCLASVVRKTVEVWCEKEFLEFNALIPQERSNSVTTIRTPADFNAEIIRDSLRENHNVVVGGGLGELKGTVFRIGHMGHINLAYVCGALCAIEVTLRKLNVPIGDQAIESGLSVYLNSDLCA